MEDKNKTETRTPKVTKGTETPKTRAEVANGSAITSDPVESGPETRQVVYENMPKVVNGAAVSVKEGTVITVKTDERNILQKGLDSIAEVFTNIDGWLEDTAEEMADYDYGGWLNIFAEYGQGYAGRGGSFTVARLLGCVTKGGEKLCYGIFAGSINLFSHPIQAAGSIDKIPEGMQEGWNQFENGNWTQRVEIATEVVGTVAMLAEAGVKMKNARNAAKARAEMEGILAEDAEAVSKLEGVGAGTSEITEDMRRLLEEYRKLSEEEQWSMWKETGCFLAGTKVSTVEGMRNIEEISVGEEVYAENTTTGKPEKRKVTRISHQKASTFVYLRINGSEICCTMEHPFWHKEKGWIKAGELLPGDTLKQRDGEFVKVTYICQRKEKEQWVYNLEVEGLHTYYVAEGELLAHNGEGVCPEGKVKIESGKYSITVSQDRLQHSVLGEFNSKGRLINGGHGQANIDFLNQNNIKYNIVKVYDNGVRVGNIPSHKNKFKRTGTGQAWFPESWTEIDIKNAGEYVANIPENVNVPDGTWVFGEYNGVRVGIIKNNGKIGTIIPDNSRQP